MQNLKRLIPVFILTFYFFTSCSSIEEQDIIEVKGKLVRELTGIGEPNVEIEISSKYSGSGGSLNFNDDLGTKKVKTNENGDFSVKLPSKYGGTRNSISFYREADQNGDNYDKMYYSFKYEDVKNKPLTISINRLAPLEIEVKNISPLTENNISVDITQVKGTNGESVIRGTVKDFEARYMNSNDGRSKYKWIDANVNSIIYLKVPETYGYFVSWEIKQGDRYLQDYSPVFNVSPDLNTYKLHY